MKHCSLFKIQTSVCDFGLPNSQRQSCNHTLSRTDPGQTHLKLYTLFRAEGPKTIPYPAVQVIEGLSYRESTVHDLITSKELDLSGSVLKNPATCTSINTTGIKKS